MDVDRTIDLDELAVIIADAKAVARRYRKLTGRPLGITGEVAEYEAVRLLGLRLADVRQDGYDAVRETGGSVRNSKSRADVSSKPANGANRSARSSWRKNGMVCCWS
jgi:hypothetical protein